MKKYFRTITSLFAVAILSIGCTSVIYAQSDYGNGYDYDNGYNDNNYDYNQDNNQDDNQFAQQQGEPQITFNDFYNQLAPYGHWINSAQYGQVWVADVANFQPYSSNGYWAYTSYGWTWVSNYSWGWAPFHYGRWGYSNSYGWYWVPGYTWGPAWVGWSTGADVYGWAPLGPGMSFGVNISIGLFPTNYWTFMPRRYMGYHNINNYYYSRSRNVTYIRHTTIINNYGNAHNQRYARGPQVRDVERSSGRTIRPIRIVNTRNARTTGVRNNELHMYNPTVRGGTSTRSAAPAKKSTTPSRTVVPNQQRVQRTAPQRSTAPQKSSVQQNRQSSTQRQTPLVKRTVPVRPEQQTKPVQRSVPVQRSAPVKRYTPPTREKASSSRSSSRSNTRSETHRVERAKR
ncbi:DUF6600 domain-containing protein [Arachidicoccus sp.]|uniref:DUF6600 domain-containing protein n=1 Tax=Arachidicoccus sp. TaxID=1872624 RepID=UPI003D1B8B1F